MVLKKSKSQNSTLFIDASKECIKVTNSNKLTDENITRIIDAFAAREDVAHFVRLVPNSEIAEQGYNLTVSTYVEQEDTREVIDITQLNATLMPLWHARKCCGAKLRRLWRRLRGTGMSKLEQLIAELCPDGVEYVTLKEIAPPTRGVRVTRNQLSLEGEYPVYQNSMTLFTFKCAQGKCSAFISIGH